MDRIRATLTGTLALVLGWALRGETAEDFHYLAILNLDYDKREDLTAWRSTGLVVSQVLRAGSGSSFSSRFVDNPGKQEAIEALRQFIRQPGKRALYLAAHMEGTGELILASGERVFPDQIARELASSLPGDQPGFDLVIWDTCHAAATAYQTDWMRLAQCPHLFSGDTFQRTWEMDFSRKYPLDFRKRFPGVVRWISESQEGGWDATISFLGFRSAWSFQERPPEPGWEPLLRFFESLPDHHPDLRRLEKARRASTLIWWPAGRSAPVQTASVKPPAGP